MESERVLIVFFSWTGATRKVAHALANLLGTRTPVATAEIRPVRPRTYPAWLMLSAIPNSKVRIKPVVSDFAPYDLVLFGFPKWTLSCPPVNEYIGMISNFEGKRIVLFMAYGGFDEKRYMKTMVSILRRKKMRVVGTLSVSRKSADKGVYIQDVTSFWQSHLKALLFAD